MLAGIDSDSKCQDTYTFQGNNLNPWTNSPPIFLAKDIARKKFQILKDLKKIIKAAKNKYPKAPLIFSICAPCQPFTHITKIPLAQKTATKRKKDKNLLDESLEYVRVLKPDAIFSENVPGIKHANKAGDLFKLFGEKLSKKYRVESNVVNAKYFGVPQNRNRTILLAISKQYLKSGTDFTVLKKDPGQKYLVVIKDVLGTAKKPKFSKIKAGEFAKNDSNHRAANLTPINLERIKKAVAGKSNYLRNNYRVPR